MQYCKINLHCFFFNIFYCCSSTVVSSPHHSPPPQPPPLPTLDPTPLWFCPCVLYTCSWKLFCLSPPLSPPTSPLVTVSLFFISMSLVIFCLLVCFADQFPLIGEIIWYLSFTAWLISLSIMLSSSNHVIFVK